MQETLGGFYYIIFGGIGIVVPILIFVLLMPVMEFLANIKYVQIGFVLIAVLIGGVYAYAEKSVLAIFIFIVASVLAFAVMSILLLILIAVVMPYYVMTYPLVFLGVSQETMSVIHNGFYIYVGLLLLWAWAYDGGGGSKYDVIEEEKRRSERRIADRIAEQFKKSGKD